jgi:hypothetical protein
MSGAAHMHPIRVVARILPVLQIFPNIMVSRLQHEATPRPDYVAHPGVPITARLHFQYFF